MPGKKLLVADDSLTIQKVIRLALSNEGYEIQTVSDGDDAIQQISLFRPDIVLIDVSLPGQSAFDVKRAVNSHEDLRGVRFVLMSSAFEKIDEKQLATLVFEGRLTKPFDPAHLRQVLSGVLSRAAHGQTTTIHTAPIPTAPIPTALMTPPQMPQMPAPPQAPSPPPAIPPRPSPAAQPTPAPPPAPMPAPPPQFSLPPEPIPDFSTDVIEDGPTAPPPGLIAEEDNYGPKYIPSPSSLEDEEPTQPFLNPFQTTRQPTGTPHSTKADSLWDDHDAGFDLPPPPAPPPAPTFAPPPPHTPKSEPAHSDDIRHLTESTIRMSGLDDFEWTVNEPSLKPPPAFGDSPDLNAMGAPPARIEEEEATEFITAPPPAANSLPPITMGSFTPPPPPGAARANPPRPARPPGPSAPAAPPASQPPAPSTPQRAPVTSSIDSAEIERIVREQVQETLEKLAQKILPEVAEKVIKQEIHRMLSEMP